MLSQEQLIPFKNRRVGVTYRESDREFFLAGLLTDVREGFLILRHGRQDVLISLDVVTKLKTLPEGDNHE